MEKEEEGKSNNKLIMQGAITCYCVREGHIELMVLIIARRFSLALASLCATVLAAFTIMHGRKMMATAQLYIHIPHNVLCHVYVCERVSEWILVCRRRPFGNIFLSNYYC